MIAATVSTIVLALLGSVPGETAAWRTGEVTFIAYVQGDEYREIFPLGTGQYTVNVSIEQVTSDPDSVLGYVGGVPVCYELPMGIRQNDYIEVTGTYYGGVNPVPYCGRVVASSVTKLGEWEKPAEEEAPENLRTPRVVTGAPEVTETTVTLQATILDNGGELCRARFVYRAEAGATWYTGWQPDLDSGESIAQKIAGLTPGTRYYFYVEVENSTEWTTGNQVAVVTLPEKVPPIAHPAVWLVAPDQGGLGSLTMTADIERDLAGPQEYYFDFVGSPTGGAGGSDSYWQFSPLYEDVGLNANQQYGYRIKARDGHGNETAYAPTVHAYTDIETPAGVTFGEITAGSIQIKASGTLSGLNRGQSGLRLENITTGDASAWQQDNTFWTCTGLLVNTPYTFRARARNGDGDLTPYSSETRKYTYANVPTAPVCADVTVNQIGVQWGPNGNPDGTQYLCQNTTTGKNSGWITGTQWLDTGLSPNVQYAYSVKARNGDGIETAPSAVTRCYSAIEAPTGVAFGTLTPNSIQARSQNTPSGLNQGQSGLWLENITTGQTSAWRQDNSLWTSDNLLPNRRYGFRVRARNGDGVQTVATETVYISTQANPPVRGVFTGISGNIIQVQWGANGNPAGTLYLCENTTAGTSSGWTAGAAWTSTGLVPNTSYSYRVKARNADGVDTAWVDLGTQSTDYRTLTTSATAGGKVTTPAQNIFRCAPGAVVNLVATPSPGYHFVRWTGSAVEAGRVADSGAAQTTVLVDAQYTLVANFVRTRIYVDQRATGTNDGSSWTNAYPSLQDALEAAQTGNEIYLAQGVYKPDVGKNVVRADRTATFELKSAVTIKGGYAGVAQADPEARDLTAYATILSGDLAGNDGRVEESLDLYGQVQRLDNSLHVVSALGVDSRALVEGVTITGGNGIDGAGVWLIRSDPVFSQCLFFANRAGELSGDGLTGWGQGAGVSCYQSDPAFGTCVFRANWAGDQGGGLYTVESSPTLTDCLFQDNEAGLQGGALYAQDGNDVLVRCTFHGNWSWDGGALYLDEGTDIRLTNCRFLGNAGHGSGGALFAAGRGLEVTNGLFSANLAFTEGGAAFLTRGPSAWTNCTFHHNVAKTAQSGQALAVRSTTAVLSNCILWNYGDVVAQVTTAGTAESSGTVTLSYCDLPPDANGVLCKGGGRATWGAGNFSVDPLFQNPDGPDRVGGTPDDDLSLKAGSPCIDAGDNGAVPTDIDDLNANNNRQERTPLDLAGRPRFVDDPATPNTGLADPPLYPLIVDMGAYEYQKP